MKFEEHPIAIRGPRDAIAAVPYLLGFHPSGSLVVLSSDRERRVVALRADLVPPAGLGPLIRQLTLMLTWRSARRVTLIGYGPYDEVAPVLRAARDGLGAAFTVGDCLRVDEGRWWPLHCRDPLCCDQDGRPVDIGATVVAAKAALSGVVAFPGRADLARVVASIRGDEQRRMRAATSRAENEVLRGRRNAGRVSELDQAFLIRMLRRRPPLLDQEAARLCLFLTSAAVRDEAIARTPAGPDGIVLWADLTRRAIGRYAAAPACLLAVVAYLDGAGALAHLALDRADDALPGYPLAQLLRDSLNAGVPPDRLRPLLAAARFGPGHVRLEAARLG